MKLLDKYVLFRTEPPMSLDTPCLIRFSDPVYVQGGETLEFTSGRQLYLWFKAKFFGEEEIARYLLQGGKEWTADSVLEMESDEDWATVKEEYMKRVQTYKFFQNKDLREKLLDKTYEGKEFIFADPVDTFWGIGFSEEDGEGKESRWGKNVLGILLTELRNQMKDYTGQYPSRGLYLPKAK